MNKKGFALFELLVIIAIIAVLAGIALSIFGATLDGRERQSSQQVEGKSNRWQVEVFNAEGKVFKTFYAPDERFFYHGSYLECKDESGNRIIVGNNYIAKKQ